MLTTRLNEVRIHDINYVQVPCFNPKKGDLVYLAKLNCYGVVCQINAGRKICIEANNNRINNIPLGRLSKLVVSFSNYSAN